MPASRKQTRRKAWFVLGVACAGFATAGSVKAADTTELWPELSKLQEGITCPGMRVLRLGAATRNDVDEQQPGDIAGADGSVQAEGP